MAENRLDCLVRNAKRIQIASQTATGCVPAVPYGFNFCFLQSGLDDPSQYVIQTHRLSIAGSEHRTRLRISAAHPMRIEHPCDRLNNRDRPLTLKRLWLCCMAFPDRLIDVDFAVSIILPAHPGDFTAPQTRECGDRENRCSRFRERLRGAFVSNSGWWARPEYQPRNAFQGQEDSLREYGDSGRNRGQPGSKIFDNTSTTGVAQLVISV